MKKWLAIGIILLFVGTCIIPTIAQDAEKPLPSSRGNWLYVGGSGPGNYSKIQDAVDNASSGDTVFVYDDSSPYNETITVNKSITVQGENIYTTIINKSGFLIGSDNVIITGFTVQNGIYGVRFEHVSNNIIENCVFYHNSIGMLLLYKSNNNSIRNCSFFSQYIYGVEIWGNWPFNTVQMNNEISYCDFFNNGFDNYYESSGGIFILFARGTKIHHCNITNNPCFGIYSRRSFAQINSNNIFNNNNYSVSAGVYSMFSFLDLRSNWWGTSQGPNISVSNFRIEVPIRKVDNGDNVIFSCYLLIPSIIRILGLLPWRNEPVPDAGRRI
jgi:Periplasmic copper-binding protein (NosD)